MKIYIGNKAIWNVPKYTFNDPHMGVRTVSIQVEHPAHCLDDTIDNLDFKNAYVTHKGETYYISSAKPTGEKSNANINYQYSLIFKGKEADLDSRVVRDLAIPGIDTFISQGTRFVLSADLNMFAQLIQSNLNYYFDDTWVVNVDKNESEQRVDIDNLSILELLKRGYEVYGARWRFSSLNGSNVITLNYQADVHPTVMNYGRVGGLAKITRTSSDAGVYNRVIGHGGSRNLPVNYFANRYDGFPLDPDPISGDVNIKNLMPKAFRDSVKAGITPYHDYAEDAASIAEIGVRETVVADNDSIYPSIAGVSKPNIGRIDQIIAYAERDSQTFDIWVKDIGFDLADDQYTTTEEAKISFTNGYMAGYEFIILGINGKRRVVEDTSKSHNGVSSKYKITLIKSEEDSDIGRPLIPYPGLTPKAGDNFVIYHIEMPHQYVLNAEERLQEWLEEQLDELKKEKPTYAIELYQGYYKGDEPEMEYLKSGNKLTIQNDKLSAQQETLYINSVTIEYGDIVVPKITLVVSDKIEIDGGRLNSIENRINKYESDQYFSNEEIKSLIRSVRTKDYWFLDEDGNLYTDRSVYSLKGVSALGLGSGGGGGGGDFDRLDAWVDYNETKANWVLSALLGYDLHTRVNSLEDSGGSSNIDIAITGSGNAVTNVSKSGNTLTFDKGINFALSTHNHTIANITGLQDALDGKEPSFTKNTAFNKDFGTVAGTVMQGNDSRIHSHSNKALLDLISQSNIDVLSKLSLDAQGNIKVDATLWATGGISALGLGEGGGSSGGGIDMLDSWANYTTAKANFYAPASLLVPFRNDTLSRLTSLESGSATSIVTTGSGNAITSLTKSGSVITATKGLTFALASHTHTIAQITGLQGALDSKATQSDIDTAIDGIEIGGRNYALKSGGIQNSSVTLYIPDSLKGKEVTLSFRLKLVNAVGGAQNRIGFEGNNLNNLGVLNWYGVWHTLSGTPQNFDGIVKKTLTIDSDFTGNYINLNNYRHFAVGDIVELSDVKLEKGNKATYDWTPAPEDQVSDWSEADVTSFSYIKNKPTTLSGYGITDAVTTNTTQTITGTKTFNKDIFLGINISINGTNGIAGVWNVNDSLWRFGSAIAGSVANIRSEKVGIGTDSPLYKLDVSGTGRFTGNITASAGVNTPKVDFGNGFTIEPSGTELVFKYNGVIKQRMLSNGTILATGGITALST